MKKLTIAELETEATNLPVWALNGSADVRETADIVISIPKLNGSSVDMLTLPATWLAHCLTEQIPRSQLLAASEFRKAVQSGLVILISPDDAKELNEGEGAEEEFARLKEQKIRVREALASRGLHNDNVSILSGVEAEGRKTEQVDPNEMSPGFVIFFDSLSEKTDIETMNALRTRGKFQRKECKYMVAHLGAKPKSQELIRAMIG